MELMTPRILVVDDERQIHASLRLRLGRDYDLTFCFGANEALHTVARERFDLCFADIHMPQMDGLAFIDAARKIDPGLGYVILSAFDSDHNLRRAIPLQVYDFVSKPLPERHEFEGLIPEWIQQTRRRRHERALAQQVDTIASDRDSARLEREIEFVASESARDALLQTTGLLTTIHAHLASATSLATTKARPDAGAQHLTRNLEEARRATDAAISIAERFFGSAYGNRDSSPAFINEGTREAINIALRMDGTEVVNKAVDFREIEPQPSVRGLSGIDFLLMMTPALGAALRLAPANTTIGIDAEHCARLDAVPKTPHLRDYLWMNRKNALGSCPGVAMSIIASAPPLSRSEIDAWFHGNLKPLAALTPRGLQAGILACHGLLAFSLSPQADRFRLILVLPV